MEEILFFHKVKVIWKHSIANISYHVCTIVDIMQVVFFSIIRYGSVSILTVHNLDISEFWFLSTHPLWITFILFSVNHNSVFVTFAKITLFDVINSSQQMTWLRTVYEPFSGYAARTVRHRWTRDLTCNVQIPAVCSLWHRTTEHQTWPTHRYWFCLSPLWQQQDSRCRILSLVSTYFITICLVCAFSGFSVRIIHIWWL